MKVPLPTGAYEARSVIAAAQRCANLYSEKNPEDEEFPYTYYPTPGTALVGTSTMKGWRGLYASTDGRLFGVVGQTFVIITGDTTLTLSPLGTIDSTDVPVYMLDNGTTLVLVDGTATGYQMDLATLATSKIVNDAFYGSNRLALIDGFMIFNRPDTKQWYITLPNQIDFDPLDFASKSGSPDLLVAGIATRRNLFLFGEQTTEIWTNTGGNDFPFSRLSGAFIQFGCASAASLVEADGSIYWLSKSPQGQCMVLRTANYERERISTFAIENEFQKYDRIDDATGYIHQMGGHYWYVLTFPTANKTWVFDLSTQQWHERFYLNEDGSEARERAGCHAFWNGRHIVGDFENGNLYEQSLDIYTDNGNEIRRIRSFPHLADSGNRVHYKEFKAAMEVGSANFLPQPMVQRSTIGSYLGVDGLVAIAQPNVARFDTNQVTRDTTLLIESASTNLELNSQAIDLAYWVKVMSTGVANTAVAPDGTLTADKLVEDTGNGIHCIVRNAALAPSSVNTWSIYVKAAERTFAAIQFSGAGVAVPSTLNINLLTGQFNATDPARASVTQLANGWWRVALTVTAIPAGGTGSILALSAISLGGNSYLGNGTSGIYLWGAQREVGALTSYIATTAATVTRAADILVNYADPLDPSEIRLRWSDTKGQDWSTYLSSTMGARGDFLKDVRFMRLGMARNRVFELSWNAACPTALNGAYIQIQPCAS